MIKCDSVPLFFMCCIRKSYEMIDPTKDKTYLSCRGVDLSVTCWSVREEISE